VGVIGIEPGYFLDEMSQDELTAIMKAKSEKEATENKVTWEQTRNICFFTVVAMNGTKTIKKPEDVFSLPWDKKKRESKRVLTKDEAKKKADKMKR
jgi:hypothetical protein